MRSYRTVVDENVRLWDEHRRLRLELVDTTEKAGGFATGED